MPLTRIQADGDDDDDDVVGPGLGTRDWKRATLWTICTSVCEYISDISEV